MTPEIIAHVAESSKFQPHFHIPLQSGSDPVLKAMRRRYRTALYRERIEAIRKVLPDASIGVDVITGFPNESEAAFEETQAFLLDLPISYLHVFTYSERARTTAPRMEESVPVEVRKARTKQLRMLSLKMQRQHYEQFVGTTKPFYSRKVWKTACASAIPPSTLRVGIDAQAVQANTIAPVQIQTVHAAGLHLRHHCEANTRLTMYPTLYHALFDLFGWEIAALKLINSFGLFVALAFVAAAFTLRKEMDRKQRSRHLSIHIDHGDHRWPCRLDGIPHAGFGRFHFGMEVHLPRSQRRRVVSNRYTAAPPLQP